MRCFFPFGRSRNVPFKYQPLWNEKNELVSVKTTNMGSLFKLQYHITLIDTANKKEFIDALRCRNGNLEISVTRQEASAYEL